MFGLVQAFLNGLYLPIQACPLPSLFVDIELRQLLGEEELPDADPAEETTAPAAPVG